MEKAGGKATDGKRRVLEIIPENIHDKSPVVMGSPDDVDDVFQLYEKSAAV